MSNNNKNKIIIAVLCILIAVIIGFIAIYFIKDLNGGKKDGADDKSQSQDTESEADKTETPQEPDIGESDSDIDPETDDKADSSETKPDSSTSTTGGASGPNSTTVTPSTPATNNSTSDWEATIGSTEVAVPDGAPKTYKEFSLTKDMSAAEAYEYIDSFLSSKYSILLNKQNKVAASYTPSDLITPSGCSYPMERVAGNALVQLLSAAKQNGINDLVLYSGYRTVASQKNKYVTRTQKYLDQGYSQADAEAKAGEYIAPPGASEHHTGLAADVCSSTIVNQYGYLSDTFDTTASYRWMKDNCAQYGFIIRYTKGDEAITGYSYEPWHLRYLGVDHAKACTELGYTYEEYHAMLIMIRDSAK